MPDTQTPENITSPQPIEQPAAHFVPTTEQAKTPGVESTGNELNKIVQEGTQHGVIPAGEHAITQASQTPNQVVLPDVQTLEDKVHPSSTGLIDFAKAKKDKELAQKHFNNEDLHPSDIPPKSDLSHKIGQLIGFLTFKKNKADQENLSSNNNIEEVPRAA